MTKHRRTQKPISDERADRMVALYDAEYARWCDRAKPGRGYEIVRNTSPNNDIIDETWQEVTNLTLREARTRDEAEAWCRTLAGRAAIRAALGAL